MKKVMNIGIGRSSFVIEEDAYQRLDLYLERFRNKMDSRDAGEVMEDVEQRIAELFYEYTNSKSEVVTLEVVERVIRQLGYPNDSEDDPDLEETTRKSKRRNGYSGYERYDGLGERPRKRLFRDPDNTMIGGVCSGLAAYINCDPVLIRVLAVVTFFMGTASLWIYIILWIAVPMARTASEKLEMRGLPVTAENLRRFSGRH
ncbi:MAG: PspC domain-containing protein [Bacteroidales bacterium]|jgi:phage shock protein PspC (stress-responsive transcriptional regulator)|nr:PspC domain-containing protein [Bacteroidales bacterium]MDD2263463.1 PspC domain-containing protein [Bacteroidales bacterium]MDD2830747.1 PspC domain-containing protein [Bacteroidales bacterium]MDD3207946.1 PspC domain-containing protein [Bacteroidales bacterium]MDD3696547.1 PspC domain-containing protein [Bacteroidales bacterium]